MRDLIKVVAMALALVAWAGRAEASPILLGQTVEVTYRFPAVGTVFSSNDVVVGPGVEWAGFLGVVNVDLSDTSIRLTFTNSGTWSAFPFSGFAFFDLNGTIPDFTAATLASTTMAGFTQSRITFDANNIWVNWQGLSYNPDTYVDIGLSADTVIPEPASLTLLGLGLVGALALRRSRT